jgi:glycosyltransferase involved in cell wall biosynthesis
MGLPILTSDLPFSRGICGDGAIYFDPEDISNIYIKILKLINDQEFRNELILRASNQLTKFETASSRADKYLKILENGIHV